jgi:ornithine cyclodeaminase
MVHYVREQDVRDLLDMPTAIDILTRAFGDLARGAAVDVPRHRALHPKGNLHILQAASDTLGAIGYKAYYVRPEGKTFIVALIDLETGVLKGFVEAHWLGVMRTGAATGVATRALARPDASVVACIGTGTQAVTQLEAVAAVRPIKEVRAYSRTAERVARFAQTMTGKLGVPVHALGSAAEALAGAHIVNIMTRSETPVIRGEDLEAGQHINAVGVNVLAHREVGLDTLMRCDRIVVDSVKVAEREGGDLLPAVERGLIALDRLPSLDRVVAGEVEGRRTPDDITLFKSHGMGLEDLYVAQYILDRALAEGRGTALPI